MKEKWSKEKANEWYKSLPWLRGSNFIGSDCANRFDMWQSYDSEKHLETADRELALAKDIGFNTIRIWLIFEAWLGEPEFFMDILEKYIALADKHGQYVMPVLTSEEDLPRGEFSDFVPKKIGKQDYALGYHQGRFPLSEEEKQKKEYHYAQSPILRDKFWEMIKNVVTKYAHDKRIVCWNVYNEPGITLGQDSIPILETMFETVRACDPEQPVTADVWRSPLNDKLRSPEEERALELSDIISFHSYSKLPKFCNTVDQLRMYGRPMICTEWLHRINHNNVYDIYPLMYMLGIGNLCWGFVVGKTQTNEPWDVMWEQYYDPECQVDYDFTKWQHDLFRPNLRPYDPHEIEIIKQFNEIADKRFRK